MRNGGNTFMTSKSRRFYFTSMYTVALCTDFIFRRFLHQITMLRALFHQSFYSQLRIYILQLATTYYTHIRSINYVWRGVWRTLQPAMLRCHLAAAIYRQLQKINIFMQPSKNQLFLSKYTIIHSAYISIRVWLSMTNFAVKLQVEGISYLYK